MNNKSKKLILFLLSLFLILIIEVVYLNSNYKNDEKDLEYKNIFVKNVGLPDLAISTEAIYIRHRSLSTVFSIFKDDPILNEYFPSTFSISASPIIYKTPSKIEYAKENN